MQEIAELTKDVRIRISYKNNNPWFVAKDVCEALFIANVSQALNNLDTDEKCKIICDVISNDTTSKARKTQNLLHISESGLYELIIRSKKKEAIKFRKWVTKEVLPTIRETGSYSLQKRSQNWLQQRQEGVGIRKAETEVIKKFIDYAVLQGGNIEGCKRYYSTFTKEIYKILGIEKDKRNKISGMKLYQLMMLESVISTSLLESIGQKLYYKDAYKKAKQSFIMVAESAGFSIKNKSLS